MAMIRVSSEIRNLPDGGEPERAVSTSAAVYTPKEKGFSLTYTEKSDGGETFTRVSVEERDVTVERQGAVCCRMCFREGETTETVYAVSPCSFDMTIRTRKIRLWREAGQARLDLYYGMTVGGADKDVRLSMDVRGTEIR